MFRRAWWSRTCTRTRTRGIYSEFWYDKYFTNNVFYQINFNFFYNFLSKPLLLTQRAFSPQTSPLSHSFISSQLWVKSMVQSHCDGFGHAQLPNLVLSKTLPPKPCPGSAQEILQRVPFSYLSFSAHEAVTPSGICSCVNPGQKLTDSAAEMIFNSMLPVTAYVCKAVPRNRRLYQRETGARCSHSSYKCTCGSYCRPMWNHYRICARREIVFA